MVAHRGLGMAVSLPVTRDGRPILSQADLDNYDQSPTNSAGRMRYFCPIHGGDKQQSLSVVPATGAYKCHTCDALGILCDFWPDTTGKPALSCRTKRPQAPNFEEICRQHIAAQERADEEMRALIASAIPDEAASFLSRLGAMSDALRDPSCEGHIYLRGRGLDPLRAADLGVGYAEPNAWPGEYGRTHGRIVYPLADPLTGRVISAMGRLCTDPKPSWNDETAATFADIKQRKLRGCVGKGVWPYASVVGALEHNQPLVVMEGPADALAILQDVTAGEGLHVVAMAGKAFTLPLDLMRQLCGIVLALDSDEEGRKAMRVIGANLQALRCLNVAVAEDWLGGAKDAAYLAHEKAAGSDVRYRQALAALSDACQRTVGSANPFNEDAALDALRSMYTRLKDACANVSGQLPVGFDDDEQAIDDAYTAKDWQGLTDAIRRYENNYMTALIHTKEKDNYNDDHNFR